MTAEQLAVRIGLPAEGAACALRLISPRQAETEYFPLLEQQETEFLQAIARHPRPELAVLAVYLAYAAAQYPRWKARGVPDEVFFATMGDMAIWYREHRHRTGKPGLVEWAWLLESLKGRLVRLGRLQYQPRTLDAPARWQEEVFPAGTRVLEVHIPAEQPLAPQAVADSLQQARAWFGQKEFALFHCHSWLLAPALRGLLPAGANLLRFQDLFTVYDVDMTCRQAEERVFGTLRDDPSAYPGNTRLQRSLRDYLQQGGRVGVGIGCRPLNA